MGSFPSAASTNSPTCVGRARRFGTGLATEPPAAPFQIAERNVQSRFLMNSAAVANTSKVAAMAREMQLPKNALLLTIAAFDDLDIYRVTIDFLQ
jgi:hypothetical protein